MRIPRNVPFLLALAAAGCGGATGPELGGDYVGRLDSPFSVEGAAVIDLAHPDLRSVSAPGRILAARGVGEGTLRILVINPPDQPGGGPITFVVRMAAGAVPPAAAVVAVSAPHDRARDFVGGYEVRFSRMEDAEVAPGYSAPPGHTPTPPPIPFARMVEPFFPGGRVLNPDEAAFADRAGNGNSVHDLGDLRGYLRFYPAAIPPPSPWTP